VLGSKWRPGERLVFGWRQSTFGPRQDTEVEITFEAVGIDTRVTVIHRGWDSIPPEHTARHRNTCHHSPALRRMVAGIARTRARAVPASRDASRCHVSTLRVAILSGRLWCRERQALSAQFDPSSVHAREVVKA
jgi:Activator of Hsp90 ATPase homolog 1-like protein